MFKKSGLIQQILNPKAAGLTDENKPKILILTSSLDVDEPGSATDFGATKRLADSRGCKVINKGELIYDVETGKLNSDKIIAPSFSSLKQGIIVWLEAHGAPGWVFGKKPEFDVENKAVKLFRDCLLSIEAATGLHIDTVLINSCYSAAEILNEQNGRYTNSSARLLSICFPDRSIIGFIGRNSSAKITGVFEAPEEKTAPYKPCTISLIEGSIMFRNGWAVEYSSRKLYCIPQQFHVKQFILESCSITDASKYFRLCPAREEIAKLRSSGKFERLCYADTQITKFETSEKPDKAKHDKKM